MHRDADFIGWHRFVRHALRQLPIPPSDVSLGPDFVIFEPLLEDSVASNFPGTCYWYDNLLETPVPMYTRESLIYTCMYRGAHWSGLSNPFRMFSKECRPDAAPIIDKFWWDYIKALLVYRFQVRFRFVHEIDTNHDITIHRRAGLWCTSNDRDLREFSTPTVHAVLEAHATFRRVCFMEGIPLDYAGWDPSTALFKSMSDNRSWFGFWPAWAQNLRLCRWAYDDRQDFFLVSWLVAPASRRSPSYGSLKYYITEYIGAFPDIPYVFSPAGVFIDCMVDACAIAGYPWFLVLFLMCLTIFFCAATLASRNAVLTLFFLVCTFGMSALMLIAQGLEYLGYSLIVIYVGAIAMLFVFVLLSLNVDSDEREEPGLNLLAVTVAVAFIALLVPRLEGLFFSSIRLLDFVGLSASPLGASAPGHLAITELLYTTGSPFFIIGGALLLLAMVGAIVLTKKEGD